MQLFFVLFLSCSGGYGHGQCIGCFNNKDCKTQYRVEGMQIFTIFYYSFLSVFIQIKNIISSDLTHGLSKFLRALHITVTADVLYTILCSNISQSFPFLLLCSDCNISALLSEISTSNCIIAKMPKCQIVK
jgi:hypothetical protein